MGVGGQCRAPAALAPGNRPSTHCIGVWVCPGANPNGCGKSRPHQDLIPILSSPQQVAIPTELSWPTYEGMYISQTFSIFISTNANKAIHNAQPTLQWPADVQGMIWPVQNAPGCCEYVQAPHMQMPWPQGC